MRLPRKFAQKSRKVVYWIHLWTGLVLGLWLVAEGLTGSLLAWKYEILEWEARQRVSAPVPDATAPHIPVSRAIAALKAYHPKLTPERGMSLPTSQTGYYLYSARAQTGGKRATRIFLVHPVTAQVYPPVLQGSLWIDVTEQFHHNLLVGVKGTVTNGFFTFFTVFMLLSGLWLWWPSTVKQFKQRIWIKRGQSLYRTLYDLHNVLGVYLYGLLFLVTVTGLVICYNGQTDQSIRKGINRMVGAPDSSLRREGDGREAGASARPGRLAAAAGSKEPLPIDVLIEKARAAWPSRTLVSFRMPRRAGQPFQASYDFFSLTNTSVPFDAATGERLPEDPRPFSPGAKSMSVMFQLHYGWFAGTWSKVLYCLTGFLPLGLFITGVWMYFNKKKTQTRNRQARLEREAAKAQPGTNSNTPAAKPGAETNEPETSAAEREEPVAVA